MAGLEREKITGEIVTLLWDGAARYKPHNVKNITNYAGGAMKPNKRVRLVVIALLGLFVILGCKSCVTPQLEFSKTAQPTIFSGAGEVITYSYTLTNTNAKFFLYSITDDKLGVVPCGSDRLEVGQSITCQMTYTTTEADVAAGSITNTALARVVFPAQDLDYMVIEESVTEQSASVEVVYQPPQCQMELKKTASQSTYLEAGEVIEYAYEIHNIGYGNVSGPFSVMDDRVDEWSCDDGGTVFDLCVDCVIECRGSYTVKPSDVGSNITNTARVQGICNPNDAPVSSNAASATVLYLAPTATVQAVQPALTITETLNQTAYSKVGEVIVYTYTVKNSGQVQAQGPFKVVDSLLDQWECDAEATLPVGGEMTCKGYYRVKVVGSDIVNSSRVEGGSAVSNVVSDTVYYITTSVIATEPPVDEPEEELEPEAESEPVPVLPHIIICDGPCP
jgi:hypothetical protein